MKLWPRSLLGRILLVEGMAVGVAILLLPLLAVTLLRHTMTEFQGRDLARQAHQIAPRISDEKGSIVVRLPPSLSAAYATAYDGRAYAVIDAQGRLLAASDRGRDLSARGVPRGGVAVQFARPPLTAISMPTSVGGRALWIVVTQNQTEPGAILDDVVDAFLWRYVAVLVAGLALLPLLNNLLVRRLVAAVQRVSSRAARIGPESLDRRLDEGGLPTEVIGLVHAINDLLARLQQGFASQREFVGNIVHELRTPLATLKMQLDRLPRDEARLGLERSLDRISHVISQLRDLASLETLDAGSMRSFDLRKVAHSSVEELAPEVYANSHTIALGTPEEAVEVKGEPTLARLAIDNLIINAIRHTPGGTAISVSVARDGSISVDDDGPGIAIAVRDLVGRRFWRADQRRSDTAGLGLSIVQRIIDVHGGSLELACGREGGASFRLRFSRVARPGAAEN